MRRIASLLLFSTLFGTASAQQVRPAPSGQIYNEIARLKNLVTVLYLAAHPDDENTRLLAWLANDRHIRTAYLSLTRGDGGQNIIGPEQGAALGLIRTYELLEARKLDGAEQYFSRAVDFGFSKTYAETFKHWDEHELTSNVVWIYRKLRPDVVICRFPPNEMAGHGQHAASAILAHNAFDSSGDRSQFTDQLKYVRPWKPKRLLWNTFRFGDRNTTSDTQLHIQVGNYAPTLGMGYGELAGISRSIHRSQGAGTPSVAGTQPEYFMTVAGSKPYNSLFDGIDTTWGRVGAPEIGDAIEQVLQDFNFNRPDKSIPALLRIREEIASVQDSFWRSRKLEEVNAALLHCAGFHAEALAPFAATVANSKIPVTVRLLARSTRPVEVAHKGQMLPLRDSFTVWTDTVAVSYNEYATEPYWLHGQMTASLFAEAPTKLAGLPAAPPQLTVPVEVYISGTRFAVPVPVSYKRLDPLRGDVIEAVRVLPPATIGLASPLIIADATGGVKTTVNLKTSVSDTGSVVLRVKGVPIYRVGGVRFHPGLDTTISITLPAGTVNAKKDEMLYLDASAETRTNTYTQTLRLIEYPHLPTLQYFTPATARVLPRTWNVTAKRIGYIEGAGDFTDDFMRLSGLQVDVLKEADLGDASRLANYDAIVTGVRALNVEKRMPQWMPVLLNYVQKGGTLVMQYNTLQELSTTSFGPYPFALTPKRVTEEDAAVTVLDSTTRILRSPNRITSADWANWVQERSLYVPTTWDKQYIAPLRMNDAGETPLDASLLYTPYGKGQYIYTGLSFFRQLPAGNPGAARLFMNLISAGTSTMTGKKK
jgi:LmbE family N-acetylglucosaminyl deacetylase